MYPGTSAHALYTRRRGRPFNSTWKSGAAPRRGDANLAARDRHRIVAGRSADARPDQVKEGIPKWGQRVVGHARGVVLHQVVRQACDRAEVEAGGPLGHRFDPPTDDVVHRTWHDPPAQKRSAAGLN